VSKFINSYGIQFSGLKPGRHEFDFEAGNKFFETFNYTDFSQAEVGVRVLLDKQSSMLVLDFTLNGWVETMCDRCGEQFRMPLNGQYRLIVKFGDQDFTETDDILVLPHGEHTLNVAQHIYEFTILSIPQRRVHADGGCDPQVLETLERLTNDIPDEPVDPRWAALKDLQKEKKNGTS
jgi:uncharacterized metal-binding protein YceD (DUF177 family)